MKNISSRRSFSNPVISSKKQVVYRLKNWRAYNRSLVQRGSLTVWLSQEAIDGWRYEGPAQRGAQFLYSDQAIETALTLRKLFGLALRQTQGFVQSLLALLALDLSAPDYSTLSRRHRGLKVLVPVQPTDEPRHLVADSTGLKLYGEGEWQDWLEESSDDQETLLGETQETAQRRRLLNDAMAGLKDRERHILVERRLSEEPKTLEELSQQYDISRERVRQIEVRAFEKLQKAMVAADADERRQAREATLPAS